jgi:hypothetical protein
MDLDEKIKIALEMCERHASEYGPQVQQRLRRFFESGEHVRHDGRCLPEGTEVPGFEPGSFRLIATVPSWDVHSSLGSLDDAVVGPGGDWKHAGDYLPIFAAEQSGLVVARLEDPDGPIGWFEEGAWSRRGSGYRDGVYLLAPSLDDFLKTLVDLEEPDFEAEADDELWEDAADET